MPCMKEPSQKYSCIKSRRVSQRESMEVETGHMSRSVEDDYSYKHYMYMMHPLLQCKDITCFSVVPILINLLFLGVCGNGLVIWVAGFKMQRSINTTWYLNLAMFNFTFCIFQFFSTNYSMENDWIFGLLMCKVVHFIMFLNMFGSIFLLLIISLDRCLVVTLPVWTRNHRTVTKAWVVVGVVWLFSAALSVPSVVYSNILTIQNKTICFNKYLEKQQHVAMVTYHFLVGFLIPFVGILVCYVIIRQVTNSNLTELICRKKFKIMTVLITTFFICWLPYHIFTLMELEHHKYWGFVLFGKMISIVLVYANSCLNPILYAFIGRWRCSPILSHIETAFEEEEEEEGTTVRGTPMIELQNVQNTT